MKDKLVTLKTLKLAKEKRFRWNKLTKPTQSLIHKWLRDKYDLHVIPYILSGLDLKDYSVEVIHPRPKGTMGCDSMLSRDNSMKRFKKYEDALEFGLQESLKMIKFQ